MLAHRLCGAGNGGFFFNFLLKKNTLKLPFNCVKVDIEPNGVIGKIL